MCSVIDNHASYEIHALIHFLHAKSMSAAEIHHELCAVCGQNVMSEGTIKQWCRMFKDGWTNDEERSDEPSAVSDLVQGERRCFTISELSCEFPQILHTVLYEIIIVRLGCQKFCSRWALKMLMGAHKTQRVPLALTFLE
jgi:hypothetical protein